MKKEFRELIRYGKPSKEMFLHKVNFFNNNDEILSIGSNMNKLYAQQAERLYCKNCAKKLGKVDFKKLYVEYSLCLHCGHLNGKHEDSDSFLSEIYKKEKGTDYAKTYNSNDSNAFISRTKDIYVPKAMFLKESFLNFGLHPEGLSFADIGAGSGYFVSAMKNIGLKKIKGYEVSEQQLNLGNSMIGEEVLFHMDMDYSLDLIQEIEVDVVSMIGVLEHLKHPRDVLNALSKNKYVKFFYISVPLFSITVFFEMIFPKVMNRQLSGAHTHLYTEESLEYMANEFNLDRIASWWFGTDMIDLHRSISVSLSNEKYETNIIKLWQDKFSPMIDSLQLEFDNKHMSSEVHMLFKIN